MYVSIAKISRLLGASAASEEAVDDADSCVEFSSEASELLEGSETDAGCV